MLISAHGFTQTWAYPLMGQLPTNPFPICGIGEFRQLVVPYGSGRPLNITGCGKVETLNPFYYSITCYGSGQLSLLINPLDSEQNYNWELFDITGHDPNEIYTNNALQITGNWSGTFGKTGASRNGIASTACLSNAAADFATFSEMPTLLVGHHYLLLVCGYSKIQADYLISFPGTTAIITDPLTPHMQSAQVGCNKKIITVVMNKQIRCNSLTEDGSEFTINSGFVRIIGASGINCNDQFGFESFQLMMSDTLAPGDYLLSVKNGSSGMILFDNCLNMVAEGEQIPFTVFPSETVTAEFNYRIDYGCQEDTIYFSYPFAGNGNTYQWLIDSVFANTIPEPVITKSHFGPFEARHIVSNGTCSDTVTKTINLDNLLIAGFQAPVSVCPNNQVTFSDQSIGNIVSWNWNFGDGTFDNKQQPPAHVFPDVAGEKKYLVTLIVKNNLGCYDTASEPLIKFQSCHITVPNAFTPNGDGKNDYLYPLNAFSSMNLEFRVYNRFGQLIFESHDPAGKWDGRINGAAQPTGGYLWTLTYTDGLSGNKIFLRGTSLLIR